MFSHSIPAALLLGLLVYAACWWREHQRPVRMTVLMFCAYLSHLLIDWLTLDPGPVSGIPLFHPFSQEHYMASPTLFLNIERTDAFTTAVIIHNLKAFLLEILLLGPPAALLWLWNRRTARA
jgi:membrane-bound metal-dependent hydrolase YbcI (DUF457 family)